MAVDYKDYYQILGVSRNAGEEEIRNAFRRLARMYHPDKTGNNRAAEDRFKEINEAYEVLSDPDRRSRYDDFTGTWESGLSGEEAWKNFSRRSQFGGAGRRDHFQFDGRGFSEFFEELFGRSGPGGRARTSTSPELSRAPSKPIDGRGEDLESDVWVTLDEVANGAVRPITMQRATKCTTCYGMGQYNAHPCEACEGKGTLLRNETYKVKIPQGIQEGAFLRVAGRGEEGLANGPAGDLYLKVIYARHPEFRIERSTLVHDLELAPWEAVLGTTVSVPTLAGRLTIKIPPGTTGGSKLRIKGRGLPGADSAAGDLILHIKIQVPASAGSKERQLWEELAKESVFHPREH